MNKQYNPFEERKFETADELWIALGPTNSLFKSPCKLIYRGQENAKWGLLPSILRNKNQPSKYPLIDTADMQVFREARILEIFVEYSDQIGLRIPGDSIHFRDEVLNTQRLDQYVLDPSKWPSSDWFEVMAFAQHHSVPTRLLDWSHRPYVAAYFASSTALVNYSEKDLTDELAIWVMNYELINLYRDIKIVKVPTSITPHLSAQSGLFTVHPHHGVRGQPFSVKGLEEYFSILPNTPLLKLTLPLSEAVNLYKLCHKAGYTAATIYPSADGVGKAVNDSMNLWSIEDVL